MEKKLKFILIILLMVLIMLIGFGGIYTKKLVSYNNALPDYEIGVSLDGYLLTTLSVDDTSEEVIYDKDGNEVNEIPEGEDESNYTKEQVLVNSEESKTSENYKLSKEIMAKRLENLGVSNYEIRQDEENGNISISLQDNDNTTTVIAYLLETGKFEMIDTDTKDVLMTNNDIKEVNVLYNQDTSGIVVFLDIQFTKEGKEKLEKISQDYATIEETEDTDETETTAEETDKVEQKTITINVNGEEFLSTSFGEKIEIGRLTISIGSATTNTETLNTYIQQAQHYATILNNGEMPLVYTAESNEYVPSVFSADEYKYLFVGILALLVVISVVYMIIRYKKSGLLASIVYLATIALFLILIRYTSTEVTLEAVVISLILVVLNTYINCRVLKELNKENSAEEIISKINKEYLRILDLIIIVAIPAIVLTYCSSASLASIGMFLFWGITSIVLMNVVFTKKLLLSVKK